METLIFVKTITIAINNTGPNQFFKLLAVFFLSHHSEHNFCICESGLYVIKGAKQKTKSHPQHLHSTAGKAMINPQKVRNIIRVRYMRSTTYPKRCKTNKKICYTHLSNYEAYAPYIAIPCTSLRFVFYGSYFSHV